VTARGRYLTGLAAVAALGALIAGLVSPAVRQEVAWGIGIGLLVQAPLGWLTVRSVGTDRFQVVWVIGMVVRLALVAVAGLALVPALRWQMVPTMAGLVGTILVLLVVEVLTVLRQNSEIKER
jgi:4-amino-4-deoxy-L-arabinose transferase-like glycosyltransferase